ncbi:hypothetical protein [Panacagrimonas sp.]|uniref:hypothetical protein n=1 Tax=Panacagrimonas sp. TaxID=2480088 RepID=UPI003B5279B6
MRRAAKTDANHADIVRALRAAGCSVQSLAAVGSGVPDIMAGKHGRTFLIEIKDGRKSASRRQLTPDQWEWLDAWRGGQVHIVESVEQALEVVRG